MFGALKAVTPQVGQSSQESVGQNNMSTQPSEGSRVPQDLSDSALHKELRKRTLAWVGDNVGSVVSSTPVKALSVAALGFGIGSISGFNIAEPLSESTLSLVSAMTGYISAAGECMRSNADPFLFAVFALILWYTIKSSWSYYSSHKANNLLNSADFTS